MGGILRNLHLHCFRGKRFVTISLYMIILIFLLCCDSINKMEDRFIGLWVGTYAHEVHRIHYPVLLELKPNGEALRIDFRRHVKDQVVSWKFSDSTLTIDTVEYVVKQINGNELSLFKGYEVKFQRAQKSVTTFNESQIKQVLLDKSWQTEVLNDDQLITTKNYYLIKNTQVIHQRDYLNEEQVIDSEFEISDYQIREYNGRFFFCKTRAD